MLNTIIYISVSTSGVNTYVVCMGDKKPQTGDIFMCGKYLKTPMCSDRKCVLLDNLVSKVSL